MTVHSRPVMRNRIESMIRRGERGNQGLRGEPCQKCDNKALRSLRFRYPFRWSGDRARIVGSRIKAARDSGKLREESAGPDAFGQ